MPSAEQAHAPSGVQAAPATTAPLDVGAVVEPVAGAAEAADAGGADAAAGIGETVSVAAGAAGEIEAAPVAKTPPVAVAVDVALPLPKGAAAVGELAGGAAPDAAPLAAGAAPVGEAAGAAASPPEQPTGGPKAPSPDLVISAPPFG